MLTPSWIKATLLNHVRICENRACRTCYRIRMRIWSMKFRFHSSLLTPVCLSETQFRGALRAGAEIDKIIPLPPLVMGEEPSKHVSLRGLAEKRQNCGANLVRLAAQPWSLHTHDIFPPHRRARVAALLRIGYQLARKFAPTESVALLDCFRQIVLPLVVLVRDFAGILHPLKVDCEMRTGAWSTEELSYLRNAMEVAPPVENNFWSEIARAVPGRTPSQCQRRWSSVLRDRGFLQPEKKSERQAKWHHTVGPSARIRVSGSSSQSGQ